jgi:hypothetical protein
MGLVRITVIGSIRPFPWFSDKTIDKWDEFALETLYWPKTQFVSHVRAAPLSPLTYDVLYKETHLLSDTYVGGYHYKQKVPPSRL